MMQYYSTRDSSRKFPATLEESVIRGLAADGGLFMPERFTRFNESTLKALPQLSLPELAYQTLLPLLGDSLPQKVLSNMCYEAFNFPVPLKQLYANTWVLELFHGPTLAFKDIGARFMARLMAFFANTHGGEIKVVVATSGDTGSAVASGFYGVPNTRVFILYPKGKVSPVQEKQLIHHGGNITAIRVDGNFDDCQLHVKALLSDAELCQNNRLTSANSINLARLLPQAVYYIYAWAQLKHTNKPLIISVPSGNFGNLTAGLIAAKLGVPLKNFIAATNVNDVVPAFLTSGHFVPRPSVSSLSNAMDVGNPSNFERMQYLFNHKAEAFRELIRGFSFTDNDTLEAIREVYTKYQYVCDPHGAIGYLGLQQFRKLDQSDASGVFLETAHPAKFPETIRQALGFEPETPDRLAVISTENARPIDCPNNYESIKRLIRQ